MICKKIIRKESENIFRVFATLRKLNINQNILRQKVLRGNKSLYFSIHKRRIKFEINPFILNILHENHTKELAREGIFKYSKKLCSHIHET